MKSEVRFGHSNYTSYLIMIKLLVFVNLLYSTYTIYNHVVALNSSPILLTYGYDVLDIFKTKLMYIYP